jgi:hypothetical protein
MPHDYWDQVFVHALRKVDMRAAVGQSATASVVVRGSTTSRRVAVYSSHPDELQVPGVCVCGGGYDQTKSVAGEIPVNAKHVMCDDNMSELLQGANSWHAIMLC